MNSRTSREGVGRSGACHRALAAARDPAGHLGLRPGVARTKYLDCLRGARKEEEVITTDHSFKLAEAN